MDCGFKDEITTLPSAFGDTGVRVSRLFPDSPDGTHALLLHGVHSSANLGHRNKFRHLAEILAARGVTPWLCETGRVSVSREECDEPLAWIEESFGGKTFGEEHDDCLAALNLVLAQKPAKLWIWGFSLGGIIALLLACLPDVHADRLILSGTGLTATPEAESVMMPMPILSTLRSTVAPDMVDPRPRGRSIRLPRHRRRRIHRGSLPLAPRLDKNTRRAQKILRDRGSRPFAQNAPRKTRPADNGRNALPDG